MKTVLTVLIVIFCTFFTKAQESGKVAGIIKGKVIDAVTNEPVSYTNIGLEGTYYGTASDSEGNFELKIPEELANKNIYFSAVGFVNKKFAVNTLFGKDFNLIKVEPQSYGIKDIDVAAQSRVLIRILTLASEEIPYNFIAGPYNFETKYSCKKIVDDTLSIAQEADLLIYDHTGYSAPSKTDAYRNLNYMINKVEWGEDYSFADGATNIDELLGIDWVRTASSVLNDKILDGFRLKLIDEPKVDGKECWLISFQQNQPTLAGSGDYYATAFEGEITVAKEDYSVVNLSGKTVAPKNNRQGKNLAIGNSTKSFYKDVTCNFSVRYQKQKPAKIEMEKSYQYLGKKITENSSLLFVQANANNLKVLQNRDYFAGE